MLIPQKKTNFALVIELERHIEILLLSNDCVIVPNLGGFMAHHSNARYDESDCTFLPPLRTLGFNPQLKLNDSLLVQSYIEAYDISYPEALQRIEREVDEVKAHLQNEGIYELNDIGTLSLNENGNYVFSPCEAGILTPGFYGLGAFEMLRLPDGKQQKQQEEKSAKMIPISVSTAEETNSDTSEEDEDDIVKIKFTWIRNTLAVAAMIIAIFIFALPTGKTEMMTRTISNLNSNLLFGMMSKDTNTSTLDIKKTDLKKSLPQTEERQSKDTLGAAFNTRKATESLLPDTIGTNSIRKGFSIVLASYVTKQNARIFVAELKKDGYAEAEVYTHNNVTRVIYGNYKTQLEAYNALKRIHQNKALEEAWVYKLK